jgi:hypothetical protein
MICKGDDTLREVSSVPPEAQQRIRDFIQGCVYCWCKNRKDEWFSMQHLMGGDNRDWSGTPLEALYTSHIQNGKSPEDAFALAGQESGWLLKRVIHDDARRFATEKAPINRQYRFMGNGE